MVRRQQEGVPVWIMAAGAAAGVSAASYAVLRMIRQLRRSSAAPTSSLDALEDTAVDVLRRDPQTAVCAIDVAALSPGMIELTGVVPTQEVAQRAARLLHSLSGVRTVINRLDTGALEQQLAHNRSRRSMGGPETRDGQWDGVRVGTGRRRQSSDTERTRPDDAVKRRTRELEISASDVADATPRPAAEDGLRPDT